jgi:uncharacterized Zn finger protein
MTLKSALQDLKETTLAAVSGLFGKLVYLASLRAHGKYQHWGMEVVHGSEAAERALRTAHSEVVNRVLRTPLARLVEDLQQSSGQSGMAAEAYAEKLRSRLQDLLPEGRQSSTVPSHLNSVLLALSSLERNRGRATRLTS